MPARVARVVVVSPLSNLDHLFDYRIPDRLAADARVGVRVKVQFGTRRRLLDGFIVEVTDRAEPGVTLVDIEKVVSPVPVLTPQIWELARAVADRQAGVAADVVRLAVPPRHAREEKAWAHRVDIEKLANQPELVFPSEAEIPSRVALLVRGGGAAVENRWHPLWALDIARRARELRALGKRMLVAVPDKRDIAVVAEAVAAVAPTLTVVRLDAGTDVAARYRSFLDVLAGAADLVIGNRQAVYAPVLGLGCIYVWEDGDPLHAEPHAPYAHARDVAMMRHTREGVALVFASHSRSTAVQRLVEIGWLREESLGAAATIIPSGQLAGADDGRAGIPEPVWRMASEALDSGGQVLIQVARRGYARMLLCEQCRTPARCSRCGGPLGLANDAQSIPQCRWCGHEEPSFHCTVCGHTKLRQAAPGVERTSQDIGRAFPRARIVTSTGDMPVDRLRPGRAVALATPGVEPLPDVGGYDVVILLDCEWMLGREGLLAVEDAMRQWLTAATLVSDSGRVIAMGVEGRLARALNLWRPDVFAADELAARRAAHFPPAYRVCAVMGPAGSTRRVIDLAGISDIVTVIGTVAVDPDSIDTTRAARERTLFTVAYSAGAEVARRLKAAARQAPQRFPEWGIARQPASASPIRVRFDDVESL